jgi:hypothetical protein
MKAEIRSPKSEINPKSEARMQASPGFRTASCLSRDLPVEPGNTRNRRKPYGTGLLPGTGRLNRWLGLVFGLRVSAFGFPSDLGFRISDFGRCLGLGLLLGALAVQAGAAPTPVPVIYGTDLFHPHVDPDDHFDLATLFALPELDVKAILLDQGDRQLQRPGAIPLRQMRRLTGREVAFAAGLGAKLASLSDDGRSQPAEFQGAVELLLEVLRQSREPVTLIMAGSVRDVCAAWNRDPGLLRQKVGRLYLNIGSAEDGAIEYNVELDPKAYAGLLRSGLPIYLCCCLPMRRGVPQAEFSTWWQFRQSDVLETAPKGLQAYFIYGLQRPSPEEVDPIKALTMDLRPWRRLVWEMDRNMWCTAPFLHAAGRTVCKFNGSWFCAQPSPAGAQLDNLFTFVPARVEVDDSGKTKKLLNDPNPNVQLFKVTAQDSYAAAMRDCLRELLCSWPPAKK